MLRSFGVETTRGAAALVLDTIVFYLARFVAPVIGLLLTLLVLPLEGIQIWMAVGGLAAAALLVWAMVMISKGEKAAGNVGRVAARVVKRLRPTVDPDAWAAAVVRFQKESSSGLRVPDGPGHPDDARVHPGRRDRGDRLPAVRRHPRRGHRLPGRARRDVHALPA